MGINNLSRVQEDLKMELSKQKKILETFLRYFDIELIETVRPSHLGRKFSTYLPEISSHVNPMGHPWTRPRVLDLAKYVEGLQPENYTAIKGRVVHKQKEKKDKKPTRTMDFLRSWEWRSLRMDILKKYGFKCQACGARPGEKSASGGDVRIECDHIKPISKFWTERLNPENLQVLCRDCNKGKGNRHVIDFR